MPNVSVSVPSSTRRRRFHYSDSQTVRELTEDISRETGYPCSVLTRDGRQTYASTYPVNQIQSPYIIKIGSTQTVIDVERDGSYRVEQEGRDISAAQSSDESDSDGMMRDAVERFAHGQYPHAATGRRTQNDVRRRRNAIIDEVAQGMASIADRIDDKEKRNLWNLAAEAVKGVTGLADAMSIYLGIAKKFFESRGLSMVTVVLFLLFTVFYAMLVGYLYQDIIGWAISFLKDNVLQLVNGMKTSIAGWIASLGGWLPALSSSIVIGVVAVLGVCAVGYIGYRVYKGITG